jgi:hypothetical protein
MRGLSDWIYGVSSGRVVLISLAIFVAFTALVLPGQSSSASKVSGDAGTPDLSFFYTPNELYRMAESYGEEGREAYIRTRFTFDLVWPVVYALFLVTSISWVSQKSLRHKSGLRRWNMIPIYGAFFDYLENVSTSLVMSRYPVHSPVVDWLASIFTPAKWILIFMAFSYLFVALVVGVVEKFRNSGGE